MSIFTGPMLGADLETTGVNPFEDRMVTYGLILDTPGIPPIEHTRTVNPGIDIPEGATAVHGVTNAMAIADGIQPKEALADILQYIQSAADALCPVVAYNATFDLTMINAECRRNGLTPLGGAFGPVLDPMVLDKGVDKYRKGSRKLVDVARHYGVPALDAHDALGDIRMTIGIVRAMEPLFPPGTTLADLWHLQKEWRAEQQHSYQQYLSRQGKTEVLDPSWPFLHAPV